MDFAHTLKVADMDNDGDKDIVTGSADPLEFIRILKDITLLLYL